MPPLCILAVVLLIILVVAWALFRNTKTPLPDLHLKHEAAEPIEPESKASTLPLEPETLAKPPEEAPVPPRKTKAPVKPDDLTKVEGIGPKVNQVLQNAGIQTFAKLAKGDEAKLRKILDEAGYGFMDPASWAEQAKLASTGSFDELKELQFKLRAGRKSK